MEFPFRAILQLKILISKLQLYRWNLLFPLKVLILLIHFKTSTVSVELFSDDWNNAFVNISKLQLYRWNVLAKASTSTNVSIFQNFNCIGGIHQISGFVKNTMPKFRDFPIKIKKTKNFQKSFYNCDYTDILKRCQGK